MKIIRNKYIGASTAKKKPIRAKDKGAFHYYNTGKIKHLYGELGLFHLVK